MIVTGIATNLAMIQLARQMQLVHLSRAGMCVMA